MINYQLKSKDTTKNQPVFAYITGVFKGSQERLKIAIGKSINPNDFGDADSNFKFNRNKLNKSKNPSNLIFKKFLENFESAVNQTELYFAVTEKKPNKDEFKGKLLVYLGKEVEEKTTSNITLIDFINDYVKEVKELRLKNKKKISDGTIWNYLSVIHHIKNYQQSKGVELLISDFSFDIYNDFVETTNQLAIDKIKGKNKEIHCKIHHKVGKSVNTISVITTRLRFLLSKAQQRGYELHNTLNLRDERLIINMEPSAKEYYLSEELLLQIYNYKPKKNTAIKGKNYVMLATTTGMRFESLNKLRGEKPQLITTPTGEQFFAVKNRASKTGVELLSPLMKPALEIYERMGQFPKLSTAPMVNYQIRALLAEMGIKDKVVVTHHVYGKGQIKENKLLSEVVSSHACRASFITNLLNLRVDRFKVQAMTHKAMNDGTAFSIYDRRSEIDRAIEFFDVTKNLDSEFFRYK